VPEKRSVTVVKGWQQRSLFSREEIKRMTVRRYQRIQDRIKKEARGGRCEHPTAPEGEK